jgi:acyl-coenzyme A synthetase/AMP-(fatty) acid ligase
MAFVLLRPEHAPKWKDNHDGFATELIRHARTLLPGFACPEWVQIVDELPVSHA